MILETERLILRLPTEKDIEDLVEGMNNFEVSEFLLTAPFPYNKKDAVWWLNHIKEADEKYKFNIFLKSNNKLVGGLGLSKPDENVSSTSVGYWVNKNIKGKE